MSNSLQNY